MGESQRPQYSEPPSGATPRGPFDRPVVLLRDRWETQVAQAPAATALVCGERTVTVAELDHLATRVTRSLLARNIGPGTFVGICLERSVEMVAAILGVIKTGAAYIPLDAEYPESRRIQILDEAQPSVVISVSSLWPKLTSPVSWLFWEDLEDGLDPSPQGVTACVGPRDPAYVIFTSGSTGRPKGVVVRQAELAVYLDWAGHRYLATGGQGAPLNTSIAFDATITSLFLPLLAGRPLWLVPQEEEIACLADLLSSGVPFDLVKLTPSHLDALRHQLGPRLGNVRVRRFVVGGEALRRDVVAPWREAVPGLEILNEYGPTETVVGCCLQSCHDDTGRGREIPIGHPTPGTRLYLLDARLRPVAEGETGELYIGGDQVAWGYLNRPAQTAERFLADPFSSIPGTRMYRTGDLARQDDRGRLEFLGRTDDQVKIRGHRIELGEIESCLLRQPGVAQAAVAVHEEAHLGQLLVGYVVCVAGMDVDPAVLTTALSRSLPPAWIPGFLLKLPALPLTPHGKLDRKALPLPNRKTGDGPAARTPVEQTLSGLYAELLGLPVVGVHDNFFALGGHSLLAMRLVSSLRRDLSLEVPLRAIFEHPTVAGLAAWIGSQTGVAAVARPRIQREHRPARPPLSSAQQRLWFLQQLQQVQDTYHIPLAHRLRGTLDIDALRSAVRDLLERHESLRTLFPSAADGPWQQICDVAAQPLPLQLERVTDEELPERLASASREVFDLSSDLPVRFHVYQLAPDEHVLLVVFHHIAIDGASQGPFWRDLGVAYAARLSGRSPGWDRLPVQYVDYTLWQQRWLGQAGDPGSVMSRELDFWKQTLEGLPDELVLPTDRPRPTDGTFRGGRVPLVVPPGLHRQLLELAHREQASLFMVLQGALAVLLSRLGAGTDIPLGSPIAGRLDELLQDQVGFFVNTLVLRTDLSGTPTFREVVRRVREFDLAAFAHQELPFEQLVQALQPQRSLARHPLFQVVLVLQSGLECVQDWPGLTATVEPVPHTTAKFDLLWELEATAKEGLQGVLEYSSALFDRESAERLVRRYFRVLEQCVASPDDCVCDIDVLEPGEKFSGGAAPDISEPAVARKSLGDCFEAVASSCHDRGAITCGFDQVTYDELNRRANRLSHQLIGMGVGPEVLVGICLERSVEMIVAMLAVVKAGGAYLPLDPGTPSARLQSTLVDAEPRVVLTDSQLAGLLGTAVPVLRLDANPELPEQETSPGDRGVRPGHAAYVIYTSGSTGQPKGAVITQECVLRLLTATEQWYGFSERDVWTMFHSFAFDFSVWEIWGALLYGGRLVIVPKLVSRSPGEFLDLLVRERVTVLNQTPSAFYQLMQADAEQPELGDRLSLKWVIFGGEALSLSQLGRWYARHAVDEPRLVNMYGITETTVHVTYQPLTAEVASRETASLIGEPIPDLRVYVLDERLRPVPTGVSGEMYVAGPGLARGYLKRPGLTAERFLADPFGGPGARMYRSGDLARPRVDGTLEYLGRGDQQVKLRGHRIELGEIEAVLAGDPGVSQVAVVLQEASGPDAALVAYVVPDLSMAVGCGFEESSAAQGPENVPEELVRRLRSCCQERLPAYMIPRDIVLLEKLPLTVNGKLDRRALPTPGRTRSGQEAAWREPATPLESQLCELFREVLQLDRIGAEDNFFALGGQSLLAMRLFAQISEGLQLRLPIEALFRSPTPRALAAFMTREPQSLVEEKLCLMFGQVLGRGDVGVHDNFFELGGHSLLAMRLHVEIAERLQVRLPIETLFRSPTPRALAALVLQHDPGAQVLVPIRPEGNARPLFLLPSATGNLLFWQRLVPHAPRQLPLWGLSPGWRAGDRVACRSLAEVVVPMVEAVLVHQPQGPIRLMGYSAGAHFAHEVARQLEARGRQVGFLGLVDAIPNKPRATWGAKLVRTLRTLIDPRQWPSLRSRLSAIRQSNRHKKVPVKRRGLPDRFERMQDQFRQTRQRLVDLLNAHQPGRTQVPVTLFRVPPKVGEKRSPGLGWGHYCSRVTVIHLDDVEHEQIIRTEHIHTLARAVFQVLDCRPDGPPGTAIAEADFDSRVVSSEP